VPLVYHTFATWQPYTRSPSSKLKRSRRTWPCNALDVAIEVVLGWRKWWLNHQKTGNKMIKPWTQNDFTKHWNWTINKNNMIKKLYVGLSHHVGQMIYGLFTTWGCLG
jgi:hypothetical protein